MVDPNTFPAGNSHPGEPKPSHQLPDWLRETRQSFPRPKTGPIPDWMRETLRARQAKIIPETLTSVKYYPTDTDPERATAAMEKLRQSGEGWKLHLNFDAADPSVVARVKAFLEQTDPKTVRGFKIGHGGGKASGAPGKEATVYVGPRDSTVLVAKTIEESLGDVLSEPEGDTLKDDIPFTTKVMGRFDISRFDPDFIQYGFQGFPMLKDDASKQLWDRDNFNAQEAAERAGRVLTERYGTFYTDIEESEAEHQPRH